MTNLPPKADSIVIRALKDAKKTPRPAPEDCPVCHKDSCDGTCAIPENAREFVRLNETCYALKFPALGVELIADRLRREKDGLITELTVKCSIPGARTLDGVLAVSDFNLSGQRSRSDRAKYLETRSRAALDWSGFLEELSQRVLTAERIGQPAVVLSEVERPPVEAELSVDGLVLLEKHPIIMFGDGGSAKSYLALYVAGKLSNLGFRVGIFDWELSAQDHRMRLEMLFGATMPKIFYARCERPLHYEADRLKRIVTENQINYAILDSVAFACDGPPEAAEVAGRYFRALRQLDIGSLNIAHISKSEGGDRKPFGSAFWHNGARSTWYVKLEEPVPDSSIVTVGLFNRKANLGAIKRPVGFQIRFGRDQTSVTSSSQVFDNPDMASEMNLPQKLQQLLRKGSYSFKELLEETNAKEDTLRRTLDRKKNIILLPNGLYGLKGFN